MAGSRVLSVLIVSILCFLDACGVQGAPSIQIKQVNSIGTLKTILDNAVKDDVISKATAANMIAACSKQGFTKQTPGEILEEALEIGWRYCVVSGIDSDKLKLWASKAYPDVFAPTESLSMAEIVEWLETDFPSIKSQLIQLSGNKLKAVQIAATILLKAVDEGLPQESGAQVTEAIIKSALEDNEDAMTSLNKVLPESVSQKLIPETVAWVIIRAAVNAGLDKEEAN